MVSGVFFLFISFSLTNPIGTELQASTFPDRALTIVVPYPAGGVTDLAARVLAERMEKHLKQPAVVVNKVGGRATVGGHAVVTAKPDGYTLGFFPVAASVPEAFSYFFKDVVPYSLKDLRPISSVAGTAMSFAVKDDSPLNSFKDFVEFAQKNPGIKVAVPGKQTLPYLVMVDAAKKEKISFVSVPTGGDAKTLPALLGGHVPIGAIDYSAMKSLVEAKKLKVLAVCTPKRVDFASDVPSIVELGYRLAYVSTLGLFGPKELPAELVKRLDELVRKITEEKEFRDKMNVISVQPFYQSADAYLKDLVQSKDIIEAFFKEEDAAK